MLQIIKCCGECWDASKNDNMTKAMENHDGGYDTRLLNSQVVPFFTSVRGDSDKDVVQFE